MAIGFVATAFIVEPRLGGAGSGLVPTFPGGAGLLIVALVGTNFSINAAFYTATAPRSAARAEAEYRDITIVDTIPGIVAPGIMTAWSSWSRPRSSANRREVAPTVVGPRRRSSSPSPARSDRPIFALGFFGAAFSSMIANATAGGTMLSDGLGRERRPAR